MNFAEMLIQRGYKEYPRSPFDSPYIRRCFQKKFTDKVGIKYFINVHEWEPLPDNPARQIYEYHIQFYKTKSRDAIDMTFHSSWNIDDVENYAEKLFHSGMFMYYETWKEDNGEE